MSHTMSIQEAARKLAEVMRNLRDGDEVLLTENGRTVGKIIPSGPRAQRRQAGTCKGMLVIKQDDDGHLDDFKDYMR